MKQFLVNLICSADGGIPVWLQVGSGHETDSQTFAGLMRAFAEPWEIPDLIVVDAALYSEPNLQQVGRLPWLSRVPHTLNAAPTLAAAYEISRVVSVSVLCASGLSDVTAPMAIAAGAAGVGVGSAVNKLDNPLAMVAVVRKLAESLQTAKVAARA